MTRLRLSAAAEDDLVAIRRFSNREFGSGGTDGYMRGFRKVFQRLREYPHSGAPLEGFGDDFRCIAHRSHRVIYQAGDAGVLVVRIIHHAQQMPELDR